MTGMTAGRSPHYAAAVSSPSSAPLKLPVLPCPECRLRGLGGGARIGNHRNRCATCSSFAQALYRATARELARNHPEEYRRIRLRAELDLYPQVLEDFNRAHPPPELNEE